SAMKNDHQPVMLGELHEWINQPALVSLEVLDQRVELDASKIQSDALLDQSSVVLQAKVRVDAHVADHSAWVFKRCLGHQAIGVGVVGLISRPYRERGYEVDPRFVHPGNHLVRHERHNPRDLMNRDLLSTAHM